MHHFVFVTAEASDVGDGEQTHQDPSTKSQRINGTTRMRQPSRYGDWR